VYSLYTVHLMKLIYYCNSRWK